MTSTSRETVKAHADTLLALHKNTPLVLPTVWDVWTAQLAVDAGFKALTVGSHPVADSLGQADGEGLTLDEALEAIERITAAVDVPVSADLESGYDTAPKELVARALDAGIAGINIEDTVHSASRLRSAEEHAEYIGQIRQAADAEGVHLVINGRTDVFATDEDIEDPLAEAIHRIKLLEEAGADSVYPVKVPTEADLKALIAAVNVPLNVTAHPAEGAMPGGLTFAQLKELGVGRVSFGPLLQKAVGDHAAELFKNFC